LQKFPFNKISFVRKLFEEGRFIYELFSCDLCLGVWVYTILAFFFKANIYDMFYFPVISEILTGITTSFIVHVFSAGWKSLYSTMVIGE
jgi:hypothetical protein